MREYYKTIFKRKSVRKFDENMTLTTDELEKIQEKAKTLVPLVDGIDVEMKIVPKSKTTAKFGKWCLLFFSCEKPLYLINAGYMLEQMDLFLQQNNIGACWYGLAKTQEVARNKMKFVIMLAFEKSSPETFRNDPAKFKRKTLEEIWFGEQIPSVSEAVRLAPSACNSQPWRIRAKDNTLEIFRNPNIKSFIPKSKLGYFNSIDMGIFLCFLETALEENGHSFKRELFEDAEKKDGLIKIARYIL